MKKQPKKLAKQQSDQIKRNNKSIDRTVLRYMQGAIAGNIQSMKNVTSRGTQAVKNFFTPGTPENKWANVLVGEFKDVTHSIMDSDASVGEKVADVISGPWSPVIFTARAILKHPAEALEYMWERVKTRANILANLNPISMIVNSVVSGLRNIQAHNNSIQRGTTPVNLSEEEIMKSKKTLKGKSSPLKDIRNMKEKSAPKSNHPEWYSHYDLSHLVAANFGKRKSMDQSMAKLLGGSFPFANYGQFGANETAVIASVNLGLVIPNDSLNSFAQAINIAYSKIRAANSGSINYAPIDLACYYLNIRSLRAALAWLRRAVGVSNFVDPYDADLPVGLTDVALGFKYSAFTSPSTIRSFGFDKLLENKANIINYIDSWMRVLNVQFPANLPIYDRTDWLLSNVFKDANVAKANYYMFNIERVPYYYPEVSGGAYTGNILRTNYTLQELNTTTTAAGEQANFDNAIANINNLFNIVATDGINIIIAGDILKAFGSSAIYQQANIDANTVVTPIYDEAALTQIQNAFVTDASENSSIQETYAFTGTSHTITIVRQGYPNLAGGKVTRHPVNTYKDSITSGELLSYTRLVCNVELSGPTATSATITKCGTEFVKNIDYYDSYDSNVTWTKCLSSANTSNMSNTNVDSCKESFSILNSWSIIDYGPMILFTAWTTKSDTADAAKCLLWDISNFAEISTDDLDVYQQITTLSLFDVPDYVKRQSEFKFIK